MNKKKIVVGENFLHAHATNSSTIAAGHVVIDHKDWSQIVAYFNDPMHPHRMGDLVRQIYSDLVVVSEKPESQKCDQADQVPAEEKEIRDLIDIRKFALDKAQQILTSNGRTTVGSSVMSLAGHIAKFIIEGL